MGSTTLSGCTTSAYYPHAMRYISRLLITLIRKLCAIVRPILSWSSQSSVARFLNRLWSFILRASRLSASASTSSNGGDLILLPSAAASMTLHSPESSPREIEEGLPASAVDRISTEEPPQTSPSPRAMEDNDEERGSLPPEIRPSPTTSFAPMLPILSDRYVQKIIMCVCQIFNIRHC